jgi:Uma2 family endonuclease
MVTTQVNLENISLEDWMQEPAEGREWLNGKLVEKNGMTLKHSRIQARLAHYWRIYIDSSGKAGEVYTEVPCRTNKQGRIPDLAYLTPELVTEFGDAATLPQSFPLIAEIFAATDIAEDVFLKAQEYLQSGCEEVWLVFGESRLVLVMTQSQIVGFKSGEVVATQMILQGFSMAVDQLVA